MRKYFQVFPVGVIKKEGGDTTVEIYEKYRDALLGLEQFSHIIVFFWFDKNDTLRKRSVLQVHPRGNSANPLTGVFATRSPVRPNLIAISTCKILLMEGNIIHIDKVDAFSETPVIDIKPFMSRMDSGDIRVPRWAKK
jgi:tRNA-Thr(GGU) m(6)t(6)A37 methyltransferase TsaA